MSRNENTIAQVTARLAPYIGIPVCHLLITPMWLLAQALDLYSISTLATGIELLLDVFAGSIVTIVLFRARYRKTERLMVLPAAMILASSTIGVFLHYLNWGVIVGNLKTPDPITVLIFQSALGLNFILVTVLGVICNLVLFARFGKSKVSQ